MKTYANRTHQSSANSKRPPAVGAVTRWLVPIPVIMRIIPGPNCRSRLRGLKSGILRSSKEGDSAPSPFKPDTEVGDGSDTGPPGKWVGGGRTPVRVWAPGCRGQWNHLNTKANRGNDKRIPYFTERVIPVLAKLTSKNQLTLPKAVITDFGGTEYFDVTSENGRIVLTPVRVNRADAVRAKLAEVGLSEADIADAVEWARRGE